MDNHYSKYTNGNRRQNGLKICHYNQGGALLQNKINFAEAFIERHRPHILGISESNFFIQHDINSVQIKDYHFSPSATLSNPQLKVSRVCVYIHHSLVYKVRNDLMDGTFSSVWIEAGLPHKKKILIANVYREWGYLRQTDPLKSRDLAEQLNRWIIFLDQWERALCEGKEVLVTGDVNIDQMNWCKDDVEAPSQIRKLRPLINELFTRIFPYGVSQLVTKPTRFAPHQPASGLDHLYSNNPEKLSEIEVLSCGSDHKALSIARYGKSIGRQSRYITKRCLFVCLFVCLC